MTERAKSAAKEIIAHAREQYGWWEAFRSPDLGRAIFMAAYRADRYDLLNATCPGTRPDIMELARGLTSWSWHAATAANAENPIFWFCCVFCYCWLCCTACYYS